MNRCSNDANDTTESSIAQPISYDSISKQMQRSVLSTRSYDDHVFFPQTILFVRWRPAINLCKSIQSTATADQYNTWIYTSDDSVQSLMQPLTAQHFIRLVDMLPQKWGRVQLNYYWSSYAIYAFRKLCRTLDEAILLINLRKHIMRICGILVYAGALIGRARFSLP